MKQGLFLIFAFCVISNAYAEVDCLQRPSCEELGYTQTTEECAGRSILPCPFNIADPNTVFCGDISCEEKCKTAYPLFAGQANTKAAIDQIGNEALAAYAANQFYVGDKNGDFGQGKWYLPSIGEWMYFYGTDTSKMTNSYYTSGATGENKTLINNALKTLAGKGVDAKALGASEYCSSSEDDEDYLWYIDEGNGYRDDYVKDRSISLRCSQLLKNIFTSSGGIAPKIGDVMYEDKTWGSAADYDGSKKAVGVIAAVSGDGRDATIINLKDLTFSSTSTVGNFDPENPYGGAKNRTYWSTERTDITGIPNISSDQLLELAKASDNCPCQFYPSEDDTPDNTCTGANKCKDASGNCVDCYSSCSAYNSSYKDSQPSGQSCSTKDVMIGSGNGSTATSKTCSTTSVMIGSGYGAEATSKDCYYDCKYNCEGANRCKDSNGNCVDCYASCSAYNSDYTDNDDKKQNGYRCSSESVWIGSGNGATATSETCYKCTCGGAGKCLYSGKCVDCYSSCSKYDSNCSEGNAMNYSCSVITIPGGSGYGDTAFDHTCYCGCTCTGPNKCLYHSMCVDCYESCEDLGMRKRYGDSCKQKGVYIGSGNGTQAELTVCYYDCEESCTGANKCKTSSGDCVDCYSSCKAAGYSDTDCSSSADMCSLYVIYIGSGNASTVTGEKECYLKQ